MSFSEPFCGCFSDLFSCALVWFCPLGPCVVQASTLEKMTGAPFCSSCLIGTFLCCFGQAYNRGNLKRGLGHEPSYIEDCLLYFLCAACAATQEYREVENREIYNL